MGPAIHNRQAALFLDRDGVINEDNGYVHKIEDFKFLNGIFELCRAASAENRKIIVVTNQAGIGRGLYAEEDFRQITKWMKERFEKEDAPIERVYFCPYHPEFGIGRYRRQSMERKPNPGMLIRARNELGIDLSKSALVGDKETDIMAAEAAGIGKKVLLADHGKCLGADAVCKTLQEVHELLFPSADKKNLNQ